MYTVHLHVALLLAIVNAHSVPQAGTIYSRSYFYSEVNNLRFCVATNILGTNP